MTYPRVNRGHWAAKTSPLEIYRCVSEKECPGGLPESCSNGRTGLACGRCLPRLYKIDPGECLECGGAVGNTIFIIFILMIPIVLYAIYRAQFMQVSRQITMLTNLTI